LLFISVYFVELTLNELYLSEVVILITLEVLIDGSNHVKPLSWIITRVYRRSRLQEREKGSLLAVFSSPGFRSRLT